MKRFLFFLLSFSFLSSSLFGQTCCSGGVPVSANLGMPDVEGRVFQFNLGVDHNNLKRLLNERTLLQDESRERITNSLLLELGYSFKKKWSIDVFAAFVQQVRNINQFSSISQDRTFGLGDIAVLVKYKLLQKNGYSWSIGIGPKIPTGKSDLRNENGLRYVADLQPGSGALDGLFWTTFQKVITKRPSLKLGLQHVFSLKGVNYNYLGGEDYRFGNEWQSTLSVSDRFILKKTIIDPAVSLRYRKAFNDEINTGDLPSTGGQWIFLEQGLTYWLNPNRNFSLNFSFPIYGEVVGTQLSPSFRINIGFYQKFELKEKQNVISDVEQIK